MSCADETGCECGNNCGEDSGAICGASEDALTYLRSLSAKELAEMIVNPQPFGRNDPALDSRSCDNPACPHRILG